MRSLIPFATTEPKTRLAPALAPDECVAFARVMLSTVVETVITAGFKPTVLATAPITEPLPAAASTVVDDQPLTAAVNEQLADDTPTLVVMADLPLLRPDDIHRLIKSDADLTIAPGLGGGTNAFLTREPAFRVDYHGASYLDHCEIADDCGATVETVDSRRLATDIDEPVDLAEVLIHGNGAAREWLVDAGFELDTDDGRVGVQRQ